MSKISIIILIGLFCEAKAFSAGFAINMQSVYSNSMSRAAESTNVKNASGFFGNGAIITELGNYEVTFDLMYILPVIGFYNAQGGYETDNGTVLKEIQGTSSSTSVADPAFVPNLFASMKLSENFFLGFGFSVPWSSTVSYPEDWVGKNTTISTTLQSGVLDLALAYKIKEYLSISLGAQGTKGQFILEQDLVSTGVINSKMEGYSYGYTVGLLYKSENDFTVGLSYRSQVKNDLKGDFKITNLPTGDESYDDSEMTLKTPMVVNFGVAGNVGSRMKLYSNVTYTQWSIFKYLNISYNDGTEINEKQAWKDSWNIASGADLKIDEIFSARMGLGLEQKAPNLVLSPTTPDSDRVIASLGLGADFNRIKIDFSFSRYFMGKMDIDYSSASSTSFLQASYTPAQYYFGLGFSYSVK